MAKSRAQRKAERRKREQEQQQAERVEESHAQHDTQVPESGEVAETEARMAADAGVTPEHQAKGAAAHDAKPPAPSRADVGTPEEAEAEGLSRKERRRLQKEREQAAKEQAERRAPKQPQAERERGRVASFFSSVMRELGRVQWPDRDTLIQASAVTLIFVAAAAAYLGVLDAIFSEVVELII